MIQKPKGTQDLYGKEAKLYLILQNIMSDICNNYNYKYIKTPTFEHTELFHRGVGEETDIVKKETYDFKDRSDRNITLRPEGTAGVVRSYIENKMYADPEQPIKLYYFSSAFRYERPQSGRLREHTQFGVEILGVDNPLIDAEIISLAMNIVNIIGLSNIILKINTIGSIDSRNNYTDKLKEYFKPHIKTLCKSCQERLYKNPLRILDCKEDFNKDVVINSPKINDYLTKEDKDRFDKVKKYLDKLNIKYEVEYNLVRGLDYYSQTVFELFYDMEGFGTHSVICGGGRYNSLVKNLGGPDHPGMGFGMGLERLMLAIEKSNIKLFDENDLDLYIINLLDDDREILKIINDLRLKNIKVETDYQKRKITNQFKSIDRLNPKYIIVIGEDELKSKKVRIKNNKTKKEVEIKLNKIYDYLKGEK